MSQDQGPHDARIRRIPAHYYQQFDADHSRQVPGEGYGGWKSATVDLPLAHTALVSMHAWDTGTPGQFPGWRRVVEYHPRADRILADVFPPLLRAVRGAKMPLFHVVGGGDYHKKLPGYLATESLAGPTPEASPKIMLDPSTAALKEFRLRHSAPGDHNKADIEAGFRRVDFPPQARPLDNEPIAENAHQLLALCRHHQISHLIYIGFAINWCLLGSAGGMLDMSRHGLMCSTIRQAVTAVENKETARTEGCKEAALWRVGLTFGFVFDAGPFIEAIEAAPG